MKVFITAIQSFLGQNLARQLQEKNHQLKGSARSTYQTSSPWELVKYSLGQTALNKEDFNDVDVLIHCAHDFSKEAQESRNNNIKGTKELFKIAQEAGVKKQIFISSYSAHPTALSLYGTIKYELEQFFLDHGQIIVRPGLVLGKGGMCKRNIKRILNTPILPLIDNGGDPIPYISIENFTQAMIHIVEHEQHGPFNLFNEQMTTLSQFVRKVNEVAKHFSFYPSIPSKPIIYVLEFANMLKIPLPIELESIKGLKKNQDQLHHSDLVSLIPHISSLDAILDELVPTIS